MMFDKERLHGTGGDHYSLRYFSANAFQVATERWVYGGISGRSAGFRRIWRNPLRRLCKNNILSFTHIVKPA
jgi:hypothetical protein